MMLILEHPLICIWTLNVITLAMAEHYHRPKLARYALSTLLPVTVFFLAISIWADLYGPADPRSIWERSEYKRDFVIKFGPCQPLEDTFEQNVDRLKKAEATIDVWNDEYTMSGDGDEEYYSERVYYLNEVRQGGNTYYFADGNMKLNEIVEIREDNEEFTCWQAYWTGEPVDDH